jgi:hypothetical protein
MWTLAHHRRRGSKGKENDHCSHLVYTNHFFNVAFFLHHGAFRRDDFLDKIGGFLFGKYSYMRPWLYTPHSTRNPIWTVTWKDPPTNHLGDVLDHEI